MSGLPPKPSFDPSRDWERDSEHDDRRFVPRGGHSPRSPRAGRSPPRIGRSPPRTGRSTDRASYYSSRRSPPLRDRAPYRSRSPARSRVDSYRTRDSPPPRRDYSSRTTYLERDSIGRDRGREYGRTPRVDEGRQRAQKLAEESRKRAGWKYRDETAPGPGPRASYEDEQRSFERGRAHYDHRRAKRSPPRFPVDARSHSRSRSRSRTRSYSRSPRARRRSPLRRTSPHSLHRRERSPRTGQPASRSPAKLARGKRDDTPEEGLITPMRSPPRIRNLSRSPRRDGLHEHERGASLEAARRVSSHLPLSSLPPSQQQSQTPDTQARQLQNSEPIPKASSLTPPTIPAPVAPLLEPADPAASPLVSASPGARTPQKVNPVPLQLLVETTAAKDKGKAREDAASPASASPLPLPATPSPVVQPVPVRIPDAPRTMTPEGPRSDAMYIDRKTHLPIKREVSPDPILIKKRWEQRRGHIPQRDSSERLLESERKEHVSYVAAMSAYHQKNPGIIAADMRRKLRQCQHELIITQLESGAAEKRRIAAEALFEKARAGTLGESLPPASPDDAMNG